MENTLIAYFSRGGYNWVNGSVENLHEGNTKTVAHILQELTGADLFQIQMAAPYPDDYYRCIDAAKQDLKNNARPPLAAWPDGWERYGIIYLGYPNYWDTLPMPVQTFLEGLDFNGKTIFPFCTHEGSGIGRSVEKICKACPTATVLNGLAIKGAEVQQAHTILHAWLTATTQLNSNTLFKQERKVNLL